VTTHFGTKTVLFTSSRRVRKYLSGSRIQNEKPINGAVSHEKIVFSLCCPKTKRGSHHTARPKNGQKPCSRPGLSILLLLHLLDHFLRMLTTLGFCPTIRPCLQQKVLPATDRCRQCWRARVRIGAPDRTLRLGLGGCKVARIRSVVVLPAPSHGMCNERSLSRAWA